MEIENYILQRHNQPKEASLTIPRHQSIYNSFSQCNNALYDMEEFDLYQYLQVIKNIPYDHDLVRYAIYPRLDQNFIESAIEFMISISSYDPRAFKVSLSSLKQIGIDGMKDRCRFRNFFCKLVGHNDDGMRKEKRFLKTNKLLENVDYITIVSEVDGEQLELRNDITRVAVYRLISKHFGVSFLEALLSRVGQILYHFNEYKQTYRCRQIDSLNRTIDGLNQDIGLLTDEMKNKKSKSIPTIINCGTSFDITNQYENDEDNVVSSESTAVLNEREYQDEVSTIHQLIETSINKVDNRISDINLALSNITSKIDDLVGSINISNSEDTQHREMHQDSTLTPPTDDRHWLDNHKGSLDSELQYFSSYSPVAYHFRSMFN